MSTALSVELLARLEALWVERDAPILSHLRDGLTSAEMDAMTASIGLRLPDELRVWWSWHDGVDPQPLGPGGPEGDVGVALSYLSLQEAIELYNRARGALVEDEGEEEVARYWHEAWLAVSTFPHGDIVVVDCGVAPGAQSPVRIIDFEELTPDPPADVESFGDAVSKWIDAIERGVYYFDPSSGRWYRRDDQGRADPDLYPFD